MGAAWGGNPQQLRTQGDSFREIGGYTVSQSPISFPDVPSPLMTLTLCFHFLLDPLPPIRSNSVVETSWPAVSLPQLIVDEYLQGEAVHHSNLHDIVSGMASAGTYLGN